MMMMMMKILYTKEGGRSLRTSKLPLEALENECQVGRLNCAEYVLKLRSVFVIEKKHFATNTKFQSHDFDKTQIKMT